MIDVSVTEGITEERLAALYADPYIRRVAHDHRAAEPIVHPRVQYLSAWVGGAFAGAFIAVRVSPVEIEAHSLLKRSALKESRALGKLFLRWAFAHASVLRVTAYVMGGCEKARNYVLKLGFRLEGVRRHACVRNGVPTDVYILGFLRGDQWSN